MQFAQPRSDSIARRPEIRRALPGPSAAAGAAKRTRASPRSTAERWARASRRGSCPSSLGPSGDR